MTKREATRTTDTLEGRSTERAALRAHLSLSGRAVDLFRGSLSPGGLSKRRGAPPLSHPALAPLKLELARAPLGDPGGLTRERAEELSELIKRLTFTWLSELGAHKARFAHPQQGDVRLGRLWEHPAWSSLSLRFSAQSIDLLIALCAAPDQPRAEETRALLEGWRLELDGDLLFHALCHLSVAEGTGRSLSLGVEERRAFTRSPLTIIRAPFEQLSQGSIGRDELVARLSMLCEPTLTTLWPWLTRSLVQGWIRQSRGLWLSHLSPSTEGRSRFTEHFNGQAALFSAIEEVARREARLDLCAPLIQYFTSLQRLLSLLGVGPIKRVEALLSDVLHSEREPVTRGFIEVMKGPARLATYAARVTRTHRFDREPPDNLLLSEYQASELERALSFYTEITNALEPTVG